MRSEKRCGRAALRRTSGRRSQSSPAMPARKPCGDKRCEPTQRDPSKTRRDPSEQARELVASQCLQVENAKARGASAQRLVDPILVSRHQEVGDGTGRAHRLVLVAVPRGARVGASKSRSRSHSSRGARWLPRCVVLRSWTLGGRIRSARLGCAVTASPRLHRCDRTSFSCLGRSGVA